MTVRGNAVCAENACDISGAERKQSSHGHDTAAVSGPRVMKQGRCRPSAIANASELSVVGEMMSTGVEIPASALTERWIERGRTKRSASERIMRGKSF